MQHAQQFFSPTLPMPASDGSLIRIRRWFADRVLNIPARWLRYRALCKAERHMHILDDRILRDIGIERSEIHSVVWGPARDGRHPATPHDQTRGPVGKSR